MEFGRFNPFNKTKTYNTGEVRHELLKFINDVDLEEKIQFLKKKQKDMEDLRIGIQRLKSLPKIDKSKVAIKEGIQNLKNLESIFPNIGDELHLLESELLNRKINK